MLRLRFGVRRSANHDGDIILKLPGSQSHALNQLPHCNIGFICGGYFSNASGVCVLEQPIRRDEECFCERTAAEWNRHRNAAADERFPELPASELDVRRRIEDPGGRIAVARTGDSVPIDDGDNAGRLSARSMLSQSQIAVPQQLDDVERTVTASLANHFDEECRRLCTATCPTSAIGNRNDDPVSAGDYQTAIVSLA